jgi:cyclophilin family peptidyl-prolyl cis-trans isomerase
MAQSQQPNSIGSQFYIVQRNYLEDGVRRTFEHHYDRQNDIIALTDDDVPVYTRQIFPVTALDHYFRFGGTPHLDLVMNRDGHTVFGHVIDGMDVVDAIAWSAVDASRRPVEDIFLNSITITEYDPVNFQP